MKVGDMVTLSSYCLGLRNMIKWHPDISNSFKTPVGIVVEIRKGTIGYTRVVKDIYKIHWVTKNPPRSRNDSWWCNQHCANLFYRNDLKHVKTKVNNNE